MTVLLILACVLATAHSYCWRLTRRSDDARLMRPAEEWEPEDVDRWLELIEPFPLAPDPARERR